MRVKFGRVKWLTNLGHLWVSQLAYTPNFDLYLLDHDPETTLRVNLPDGSSGSNPSFCFGHGWDGHVHFIFVFCFFFSLNIQKPL